MTTASTKSSERADLLETLAAHRRFLTYTARDLDDDQATRRTTVSALCIAGIIKHVTEVEAAWTGFILDGPSALSPPETGDEATANSAQSLDRFAIAPGESLALLLASYEAVAKVTDELVGSLESLEDSRPLPAAPWFKKGARWSARRVLLHLIAETSQHAGHADIIRESLDGAKTMG